MRNNNSSPHKPEIVLVSTRKRFSVDTNENVVNRRQRGRVVRAPDLKSVGRGFKSRSDR